MVKIPVYFFFVFFGLLFVEFAHCEDIKSPTVCIESRMQGKGQFIAPSCRFLSKHSLDRIFTQLKSYDISLKERQDFCSMMALETEGFIGYHGGCSDYLLFQDLIRFVVKDVLKIQVRDDFHFLRIPGTEALCFDSAYSFLKAFGEGVDDTTPYVRQHILSLNIALFQSYDFPLELTPRYYLQNQPWTTPDYWTLLLDFAERVGIQRSDFESIIALGRSLLPQDRGMLMQLYVDGSDPYPFIDDHLYAAYSGGKPLEKCRASYFITSSVQEFPQLRLVINNKHVLNPFSRLRIRRYDVLTDRQRQSYQKAICRSIQALTVDEVKCKAARAYLLSLWN